MGTDDGPYLLSEVVVTNNNGGGGRSSSNFGGSIHYTGGRWSSSHDETGMYGSSSPPANDYGNPYTGGYGGSSGGGGLSYQTAPISHQQENDRDIFLKRIFGDTSFSVSDQDWGAIGSNTFSNQYSANGFAIHRITTNSNMKANLSPVLNQNGDYSIRNLKGVKVNITISGDTIAPYQGVDIRLSPIKMTINGQEIKPTQYQTPQFIQGGSVPSIPFEMFIDSTYLKGIANTTRKMVIEFEGIYVDRNGNTIMCDPITNILPNKVNLKVEIPTHQF